MNTVPLTKNEKAVLDELEEELRTLLGSRLVKFVLFGSKARGDYDRDSDVDIAIVVKGLTTKCKHEILDTVAAIEIKYLMPLSTFVLSDEDFRHLKERERAIALNIEKDGIPL